MRALHFLNNQQILMKLQIDKVEIHLHLSFLQLLVGNTNLYMDTSGDIDLNVERVCLFLKNISNQVREG